MNCDHCGRDHIVDMLVPNDVWIRIHDGAYNLCPECMNLRMIERGIIHEGIAQCHGNALSTAMTDDLKRVVIAWRAPQQIGNAIGNPKMSLLFKD